MEKVYSPGAGCGGVGSGGGGGGITSFRIVLFNLTTRITY